MGEKSNISWTDATWNTIVGCSKVSAGCKYCYAESLALRWKWTPHEWAAAYAEENVILKPQKLNLPRTWKEPKMIFVNSLSDVFHAVVPDAFITQMFDVMADCPQHTFQILTKRPERMAAFCAAYNPPDGGSAHLPNVWLGTSVEDQRAADERTPHLLATPAAVRFLSCEPLLGPLNLHAYLWEPAGPGWAGENPAPGLDWIIAGGESGSYLKEEANAGRWMQPLWARWLRDRCVAAGVAFFMKQHSALRPGQKPYIEELDGTHTEWHQFPRAVTP